MRRSLLFSRFFDPKRYDLANVGRYKMNKKLHIKNRLFNQTIAETFVDPETGEIIAEAGTIIGSSYFGSNLIPYLENRCWLQNIITSWWRIGRRYNNSND